jgi:hypothetical protein
MDQSCPVVHKSRRLQAALQTVTLFYIHCANAHIEYLCLFTIFEDACRYYMLVLSM